MPPQTKITEDMIVEAAFRLVREEGAQRLNVRTAAQMLGCSTQPIMSRFPQVEALRQAVYRRADDFHTAYIMADGDLQSIGLRYIRFGAEEKQLFRFLFQSDSFAGRSLTELITDDALAPLLTAIAASAGCGAAEAERLFRTLLMFVHGYASMLANNAMVYDEAEAAADLMRVWHGAAEAARKEEKP